MPDRVLQNHYCVAALQHQPSYNFTMIPPAIIGETVGTIPTARVEQRVGSQCSEKCVRDPAGRSRYPTVGWQRTPSQR